MPKGYSRELLEQYMQEEQKKQREQETQQKAAKKAASEQEQMRYSAQLALEEVQKCSVKITVLEQSLKKYKAIAIAAIVIAVICMAMVMGDELAAMQSMLP